MFRGWVRNHLLTDLMILNHNTPLNSPGEDNALMHFKLIIPPYSEKHVRTTASSGGWKQREKKERKRLHFSFPGWGARVMKCWWLKPMMKLGHVTQIRDEGFIIASPWDLRCWVPTVRAGLMMTNVSLCRLQKGGEKVEGGKKPPQESENKPKESEQTAK